MAQTVEISLRIPSLRHRPEGSEDTKTIVNSDLRFRKLVELESIPKPDTVLTMQIGVGPTFECRVVRSDWHETKNMFVVACTYAKRSISMAEYQAFVNATDWQGSALI
jgi:hypothetical protein